MIAFIDDHRAAYGVEPICNVLPIDPSTYHAHVVQRLDPSKRLARARRDATLRHEVTRVFAENFEVYGARKVWRQPEGLVEAAPVDQCAEADQFVCWSRRLSKRIRKRPTSVGLG